MIKRLGDNETKNALIPRSGMDRKVNVEIPSDSFTLIRLLLYSVNQRHVMQDLQYLIGTFFTRRFQVLKDGRHLLFVSPRRRLNDRRLLFGLAARSPQPPVQSRLQPADSALVNICRYIYKHIHV